MDDETAEKIGEVLAALLAMATGSVVHRVGAAFKPGDFERLDIVKDREEIRGKMAKNISDAVEHCIKTNQSIEETFVVWPKKFHTIAESLPVHFAPEHVMPTLAGVEAECWQILTTQ